MAPSNETQPLDSPQNVANARKTLAPLAEQIQDNTSANEYVNHPCNHHTIIEDGTDHEGQPIQNCQSERGQCKFETEFSSSKTWN